MWKVGGTYTQALERVVYWLEQAISVAENDAQRRALELLVQYYRSGDLRDFDAYNIAWVKDTASRVDAINGFIEVYNDPLGMRGSFESVVSFRDDEATRRIAAIASNAQWFEDNSPIMPAHREDERHGYHGQGDHGRLRNRRRVAGFGERHQPAELGLDPRGARQQVCRALEHSRPRTTPRRTPRSTNSPRPSKRSRARSSGPSSSGNLFVDMHEVIGHASGIINAGIGTPTETLKQYYSPLEEGRADLVALYYLMDPKLIELGVMPSIDVGLQQYDNYFRSGLLTQLYRIEPGKNLEEAHMRNRQMIAAWVYERAQTDSAVERITRDGKTYFVVHDYQRVRELFGELLREVQRIKSEGDFAAGQALIENYGTIVDRELHAEVLRRHEPLDVAAFSGFINPRLVPVMASGTNEITDVRVNYPRISRSRCSSTGRVTRSCRTSTDAASHRRL